MTIAAATEIVFYLNFSASHYLEMMADIGAIIAPVMKLDSDLQEWGDGNIEASDATDEDKAAIARFKEKYSSRMAVIEGDIF